LVIVYFIVNNLTMTIDEYISLSEGKKPSTTVKKIANGKYKVYSTRLGKTFGPEFKSKAGAEKWDRERREAYFAGKKGGE